MYYVNDLQERYGFVQKDASTLRAGRRNIFGLTLPELEEFFLSIGEKKFRGAQVFQWMYQRGVSSFSEMTDLSMALRHKLEASARLVVPAAAKVRLSTEEETTQKILFELEDGQKIESVYIPDGDRRTICVSTQAGCAVGCVFCATGWMGFRRHLSVGEIVGQVTHIRRAIDAGITNIVFMGMGEPFLNYEHVITAAGILSDERGPGLAGRRITISTSGIVPRIYDFAREGHPYNLAISLNATTDEVRRRVMPITQKYPLNDLLEAARFLNASRREPVTLEYVLLAGVNDSNDDAARLKTIARNLGRCKVNVIPYNPIDGPDLQRPSDERIEYFMRELAVIRSPLTLRRSRGQDIAAACGQLAIRE